ncbi:hypothetical protein [Leptotrichia hofstadii]|uniref:hypothetical protein n=1 Tax=Leptotrichia hofstadii TaxID=157688 RepID=UPI001E64AB6D|nr:hypothetical protein [Leptotrichia hofstadii]
MKKGIGKSHSKIILIGEHSVVYGYPAIAIPLKKLELNVLWKKQKAAISIIRLILFQLPFLLR